MGMIIIGAYFIFVSMVLAIFRFIRDQYTHELTRRFIAFLGYVVALSPFIFVYGRDYLIANEVNHFCKSDEGIVVVDDIGDKLVEFNYKLDRGTDRELWRLLFSHPEKSLVINIKRSKLVKEPGRYLFKAMKVGSPQCIDFNNYIENYPALSQARIKSDFPDLSTYCIGIIEENSTANTLLLDYKKESFISNKNPFYSVIERKVSLVNLENEQELVFQRYLNVNRYFPLLGAAKLFDFSYQCSAFGRKSKYSLLKQLYK